MVGKTVLARTRGRIALLFALCPLVAFAQAAPTQRSFDLQALSPRFWSVIPRQARLTHLATGFGFTEGPVWDARGFLYISDEVQNRIYRLDPGGRRETVVALGDPDGNAYDLRLRLLDCASVLRAIIRVSPSGQYVVLADRYQGKRLNSPNDLVVKKNGDIYFTDPTGLFRNYPPNAKDPPKPELMFNGVYRVTAAGKLSLLTNDMPYPNGIAFSPDEKKLYVANSRDDKYWMIYDVKPDGMIANGQKFFDVTKDQGDGVPDGMKIDTKGNVYATAPLGVMIFTPDGTQVGTLRLPEIPSNLAFGDADGKTLYITARTGLYRVKLGVAGLRP